MVPEHYKPDVLENYELGFKSQWLDNRLLFNVSLFFMEWSDIQLRGDTSRRSIPGGCAEPSTAARPSRRASSCRSSGSVNDRFSFEIGGFLADPEFSESFITPAGNPVEEGWPMPDSPEEKLWAAVEYRVPGFLIQDGEFWTRLSYSYQGEFWNSLDDIRCVNNPIVDGEPGARPRMTSRTPEISSSRRGPPVRCNSACRPTTAGMPR